jgi:hypothetical protein
MNRRMMQMCLLLIVLDQKMESAWVEDGPLTGDPELKTRSLPAWVRNKGLRSDLINATAQYKVTEPIRFYNKFPLKKKFILINDKSNRGDLDEPILKFFLLTASLNYILLFYRYIARKNLIF